MKPSSVLAVLAVLLFHVAPPAIACGDSAPDPVAVPPLARPWAM